MLVVTRKLGESVSIGRGVRVTLLSIAGQRIRMGIEAPKRVRILRDELRQKANGNGRAASNQ